MDQLLRTLPPRVLAFGAIVIGFILILLSDPPRTVCDTQFEIFKEAQSRFLFERKEKGVVHKPEIDLDMENCRRAAGPGGCMELFERLKRMVTDLDAVPRSCGQDIGALKEIRHGIWEALRLMILLGWGEKPPIAYTQRYGWLDSADIALFCSLKGKAIEFYGKEAWLGFKDRVIKELPQASTLSREQIWRRSLVSTVCDNFR